MVDGGHFDRESGEWKIGEYVPLMVGRRDGRCWAFRQRKSGERGEMVGLFLAEENRQQSRTDFAICWV